MKFAPIFSIALLLAPFATLHADIFGSGGNIFTIDFVSIGNAGNADDAALDNTFPDYSTPFGGVSYEFRMGVTEVPQDWITKASNLGLSSVTAGAWAGLQPAANMTWYEAAAFVNWLNTSTGHQAAYQLTGVTSLTLWSSGQAWQTGGENLYRHKDAYYFLPNEDEWYKAAFHRADGVTANYWDYASGGPGIPGQVTSGTGYSTAVYDNVTSSPAAVNNNGGLSTYGARGMNGNVSEWVENPYNTASPSRTIRGGNFATNELYLRSSFRPAIDPSTSSIHVGFRVASVPEPSSMLLMSSAGLGLLLRRWRIIPTI